MFDDLIGVPFVDGGRSLAGMDCWGLVMEIYKRYGVKLPDYKIACEDASSINNAIDSSRFAWERIEGSPPSPSLVVIRFNTIKLCNHTGVYIGDQRFIHTRKKIGVNVDSIDSPAWKLRIEGFYTPKEVL